MAPPTLGTFLTRLRQAMAAEALADCPDRELVERLRAGSDEAAFRAVLERHGPMVYQVCRRALTSPADVEDAFQATFLVLVRRGHAIRKQVSLASWLHGVARRTALKLRTEAGRRRRREGAAAGSAGSGVADDTSWGELRGLLDEELGKLPAACRDALVLCYLEGRTQDEAAEQLGVTARTIRRHLDRGRQLLGRRLARRGVTLGAALGARLVFDCSPAAAVPRVLFARTAESARHPAAPLAAPAGVLPARVAALSDGVLKTMQYAKYQTAVAVLTCGLALGFGATQFGPKLASAQEKKPTATARPPKAPDIEPIDPHLVFDGAVQKRLRLSPNQVRHLTEARDQGTQATPEGKRVAEIDERVKQLEEEIARLQRERDVAQATVRKGEADRVKAAIPQVLSRDAVGELRQITLQRMRLSDVLLDARVRARLGLDDEQVKKIQELADSGRGAARLAAAADPRVETVLVPRTVVEYRQMTRYLGTVVTADPRRSDLLKVLTPEQREALERLAGVTLDKAK